MPSSPTISTPIGAMAMRLATVIEPIFTGARRCSVIAKDRSEPRRWRRNHVRNGWRRRSLRRSQRQRDCGRHRVVEHRGHDEVRREIVLVDGGGDGVAAATFIDSVMLWAPTSKAPRKMPGNASTLLIWFGKSLRPVAMTAASPSAASGRISGSGLAMAKRSDSAPSCEDRLRRSGRGRTRR